MDNFKIRFFFGCNHRIFSFRVSTLAFCTTSLQNEISSFHVQVAETRCEQITAGKIVEVRK
jgi:hypothetical protein